RWSAGECHSDRRTALNGLRAHETPAAEHGIYDSAVVPPMAALAEWQIINERRHEAMRDIEIRAALFQIPVVIGDAARRSVRVRIREVFRPGIESVDKQTSAITFFHANRRAVISVMAEIGVKLDRAKLWVGLEILVIPPDVVQCGVIRS